MFRISPPNIPVLLAAVSLHVSACSNASDGDTGSPGGTDGANAATGDSATEATGGTSMATGSSGGRSSGGSGAVSTGGIGESGLAGSGGRSTGGIGAGGRPGSGGGTTEATGAGGHPGSGGISTGGPAGSGGISTSGTGTSGPAGTGGATAGGTGTSGPAGSGGTDASGLAGSGGVSATGSGGVSAGGTGDGGSATGGQASAGGDSGGRTETGGTAGAGNANQGTPSAGCGKAPTLTSGEHSIQSGGQNRRFMMRIPETYDNTRPHRLIFAFHWNGGTMQDVDGGGTSGYTWSYYGLRERAENSTIFVAPQGNGNGWANSGGQDLTFVDDMVALLEEDLCIDKDRLFSMGFSYGGGMSYAIACDRADIFRAVAVYAGMQLSGCGDGTLPIAYMGIHSVNDPTCGYGAGEGLRDTFVRNNNCTPQDPPEPATGSRTHIITEYEGCDPGYPVVWAAFEGPGHTPAPVDGATSDSGGGDVTWTKEEVWDFFTRF